MSRPKRGGGRPSDGLVLDSSIAVAWCFNDEQDAYSQSVLSALPDVSAIVPSLWHLEVANTLLVGERRKRSTQTDTVHWMGFLGSLFIEVDDETQIRAFGETANLARAHGLSAYDAAYLELAMRRGFPLATLDEKLRGAARAVGVPLHGLR